MRNRGSSEHLKPYPNRGPIIFEGGTGKEVVPPRNSPPRTFTGMGNRCRFRFEMIIVSPMCHGPKSQTFHVRIS